MPSYTVTSVQRVCSLLHEFGVDGEGPRLDEPVDGLQLGQALKKNRYLKITDGCSQRARNMGSYACTNKVRLIGTGRRWQVYRPELHSMTMPVRVSDEFTVRM